MSQKKLLQLNVTANWGSTGKIAENLGKLVLNDNWESYIAYGRYANKSDSHLIKVGNQFDFYSHYAKNRFLDGEGLGSKKPTIQLITQIKEINPDIIHLHNIHDHWLNYPILFEYLHSIKTPIVWTFHDCWAFTGGCCYFEMTGCEKWKSNCCNCKFKKTLLDNSSFQFQLRKKLFEKIGTRLNIISVSKWLDDRVAHSFLKNNNHIVINNGIDLDIFYPNKGLNVQNNIGNKTYIVSVAFPWSDRKGFKDFLELRKILDPNINIVLIGLPKKQINVLPSGIIGLPKITQKELQSYYSNALAVVSLSKEETFGMTIAEGLACGTPAIAYKNTAMEEIITPKTGIVIEKGDVNCLASVINGIVNKKIIFDPKECHQRAETHFNQDIQFSKYIDLYHSLLN